MRRLLPLLLLLAGPAEAARPRQPPPPPEPEAPSRVAVESVAGQTAITLSGPILQGTDTAFAIALTRAGPRPRVFLDSPGGLVAAGLTIGRLIRANGLETVVAEGAGCYSSCGLIWLAGSQRWMAPGARVGFHAASTRGPRTRGAGRVSSSANAVIGGYLSQLGFGDLTIAVLTAASPAQMLELNSLRPDQLARLDIAFRSGMPPVASPPPAARPQQPPSTPPPRQAGRVGQLAGLWEGQFRCGRDVHAAKLFVWPEGTGFNASFEFGPSRESPNLQHAAYQMYGRPLPDGRVGFQPGQVSLPNGQAAPGLTGEVEGNTLRAQLSERRCAAATLQRARQ